MQLKSLDETDYKLLNLINSSLKPNNSELAKQIGLTRTAVANRIKAMETSGLIRGYEVKLNPEAENTIQFVVNATVLPEEYDYFIRFLSNDDMITKIQALTGECRLIAYGVAPSIKSMEALYQRVKKIFTKAKYISFDVIASTYKDVDGGITTHEGTGKKCS